MDHSFYFSLIKTFNVNKIKANLYPLIEPPNSKFSSKIINRSTHLFNYQLQKRKK